MSFKDFLKSKAKYEDVPQYGEAKVTDEGKHEEGHKHTITMTNNPDKMERILKCKECGKTWVQKYMDTADVK